MNLELMPASLNREKSNKVTERARVFAKELYDAKLLSEEGWKRVEVGSSPKVMQPNSHKKEASRPVP